MNNNKIIKKINSNKVLILIILIVILLRFLWIGTLIERDEGTFGQIAWRMTEGEMLYKNVFGVHPPGIYIIYNVGIELFGNSIEPIRIMNNLLFFISIVFLYVLIKKLYGEKTALFSSMFYGIAMNVPALEAHLAMSESFMIPLIIIAAYFFLKFREENRIGWLLLSSLFMCLVAMIRLSGLMGLITLLLWILIFNKRKKKKSKFILVVLAPVLLIFSSLLGFFFIKGGLLSDIIDTFVYLYIRPQISKGIYNYMPWEHYLLIFSEVLFLLIPAIIGIVILFRHKAKKKFILVWLVCFLIVTLIPPAFGHYFIQIIPPLAVLAAIGTIQVIEQRKNKTISLIVILVIIISFGISGFMMTKHVPDMNVKYGSIEVYYSEFKSRAQQEKLVDYIKSNTNENDSILVFSWSPFVYWLTEKHPPFNGTAILKEDMILNMVSDKNVKYIIIPKRPLPLKMHLLLDNESVRKVFNEYRLQYLDGIEIYEKK